MYGNGARTGMEATIAVHRLTLQDLHLVLTACTACTVAAAGAAMRGAAECHFVTLTIQTTGTTTLVCAFLFLSKHMNPEIVLS